MERLKEMATNLKSGLPIIQLRFKPGYFANTNSDALCLHKIANIRGPAGQ
jgi:hypothetical protein